MTNGVGIHWRSRELAEWLAAWARSTPVAICSLLPPNRWQSTDLGTAHLRATAPVSGAVNSQLIASEGPRTVAAQDGVTIFPVFPLTEEGVRNWAAMEMSRRGSSVAALPLAPDWSDSLADLEKEKAANEVQNPASVTRRVADFQRFASEDARQWLGYFSAIPLSVPVMRLVQHTMLPDSPLSAMAEVLMSGLVIPWQSEKSTLPEDPESTLFDFTPEAREYLRDRQDSRELGKITRNVITAVNAYIERRAGLSVTDFEAFVADTDGTQNLPEDVKYFAQVTAAT